MSFNTNFEPFEDLITYGSFTNPSSTAPEGAHYIRTTDGTQNGEVLETWVYDSQVPQWNPVSEGFCLAQNSPIAGSGWTLSADGGVGLSSDTSITFGGANLTGGTATYNHTISPYDVGKKHIFRADFTSSQTVTNPLVLRVDILENSSVTTTGQVTVIGATTEAFSIEFYASENFTVLVTDITQLADSSANDVSMDNFMLENTCEVIPISGSNTPSTICRPFTPSTTTTGGVACGEPNTQVAGYLMQIESTVFTDSRFAGAVNMPPDSEPHILGVYYDGTDWRLADDGVDGSSAPAGWLTFTPLVTDRLFANVLFGNDAAGGAQFTSAFDSDGITNGITHVPNLGGYDSVTANQWITGLSNTGEFYVVGTFNPDSAVDRADLQINGTYKVRSDSSILTVDDVNASNWTECDPSDVVYNTSSSSSSDSSSSTETTSLQDLPIIAEFPDRLGELAFYNSARWADDAAAIAEGFLPVKEGTITGGAVTYPMWASIFTQYIVGDDIVFPADVAGMFLRNIGGDADVEGVFQAGTSIAASTGTVEARPANRGYQLYTIVDTHQTNVRSAATVTPTVSEFIVTFNQTFGPSGFDTSVPGDVYRSGAPWNAGAFSTTHAIENVGDALEFDIGAVQFIAGLTDNPNPTVGWQEIDVGVNRVSGAQLWTAYAGTLNAVNFATTNGDTVRMELLSDSTIDIKVNGVDFAVSGVVNTPLYPIFASGNGSGAIINTKVLKL